MAKHVVYEWDMLVAIGAKLLGPPAADPAEHNARVESFLLHARQIHDFLYRDDSSWPDHVLACDYVSDWRTRAPIASRPATLNGLRDRVGEIMAHLTLERIAGQQWDCQAIGRDVLGVVRTFYAAVQSTGLFPATPRDLTPAWAQVAFGSRTVTTTTQF